MDFAFLVSRHVDFHTSTSGFGAWVIGLGRTDMRHGGHTDFVVGSGWAWDIRTRRKSLKDGRHDDMATHGMV
jgi:homoaconitase/3-isopropylmalate dehydratase large subunit